MGEGGREREGVGEREGGRERGREGGREGRGREGGGRAGVLRRKTQSNDGKSAN